MSGPGPRCGSSPGSPEGTGSQPGRSAASPPALRREDVGPEDCFRVVWWLHSKTLKPQILPDLLTQRPSPADRGRKPETTRKGVSRPRVTPSGRAPPCLLTPDQCQGSGQGLLRDKGDCPRRRIQMDWMDPGWLDQRAGTSDWTRGTLRECKRFSSTRGLHSSPARVLGGGANTPRALIPAAQREQGARASRGAGAPGPRWQTRRKTAKPGRTAQPGAPRLQDPDDRAPPASKTGVP